MKKSIESNRSLFSLLGIILVCIISFTVDKFVPEAKDVLNVLLVLALIFLAYQHIQQKYAGILLSECLVFITILDVNQLWKQVNPLGKQFVLCSLIPEFQQLPPLLRLLLVLISILFLYLSYKLLIIYINKENNKPQQVKNTTQPLMPNVPEIDNKHINNPVNTTSEHKSKSVLSRLFFIVVASIVIVSAVGALAWLADKFSIWVMLSTFCIFVCGLAFLACLFFSIKRIRAESFFSQAKDYLTSTEKGNTPIANIIFETPVFGIIFLYFIKGGEKSPFQQLNQKFIELYNDDPISHLLSSVCACFIAIICAAVAAKLIHQFLRIMFQIPKKVDKTKIDEDIRECSEALIDIVFQLIFIPLDCFRGILNSVNNLFPDFINSLSPLIDSQEESDLKDEENNEEKEEN